MQNPQDNQNQDDQVLESADSNQKKTTKKTAKAAGLKQEKKATVVKEKTEVQKARERERRKRRRQKMAEKKRLAEGQDVSFLKPQIDDQIHVELQDLDQGVDLSLEDLKDPEGEEFSGKEMPKMIHQDHEGTALDRSEIHDFEDKVNNRGHFESFADYGDEEEHDEEDDSGELDESLAYQSQDIEKNTADYFADAEILPTTDFYQPTESAESAQLDQADVENLEFVDSNEQIDVRNIQIPPSMQVFEGQNQNYSYEERSHSVESNQTNEPNEPVELEQDSALEAEMERKRQEDLQKAAEIAAELENDQLLEEIPVKQDFLGKMFDWLNQKFGSQKSDYQPISDLNYDNLSDSVSQQTEQNVDSMEINNQDLLDQIENNSGDQNFMMQLIKKAVGFVLIIVFVIAAFWIGSSLKLIDHLGNLFGPGDIRLVLQKADENLTETDAEIVRSFGFQTAIVFGDNLGAINEIAYPSFKVAYYYGKLQEPIFYGETGITAALYYGLRNDEQYLENRFAFYILELEKLHNIYTVDIDDYLNRSVRRDLALDEYLDQLQKIFDQGNNLRKEIGLQLDDFKVVFNETIPEKQRFETDFFASIDTFEAEKANQMLDLFIEADRKHNEYKAKIAALTKLYQEYEKVLISMKLKIEGIEKNKGALVSGVKVREIPNSGLTLILE